MLNDPAVTYPNLVKPQIFAGTGSVLGGGGRLKWRHENPMSGQNSQAVPTLLHWAALLMKEPGEWGLAVLLSHPNWAARPEVAGNDTTIDSLFLKQKDWKSLELVFIS